MSQQYHFVDDSSRYSSRKPHRRAQRKVQNNAFDSSVDSEMYNDGNSLTYSASSSQAGESTDSSIAESHFDYLLENSALEKEQLLHLKETDLARRTRSGKIAREGSSVADSLNLSDDDSIDIYNHPRIITGQPSDSQGNDGGGITDEVIFTEAEHYEYGRRFRHPKRSSPRTQKKVGRGVSSPATVIHDGLDESGSTPTSPPPRYGKKNTDQQNEVWYAKWWMCGFADAFNPKG